MCIKYPKVADAFALKIGQCCNDRVRPHNNDVRKGYGSHLAENGKARACTHIFSNRTSFKQRKKIREYVK